MLRPATPHAIDRLVAAIQVNDRELDTALIQLGVLPPLHLSQIRACLGIPGATVVAAQNQDGHRVLDVIVEGSVMARIHHDGQVVSTDQSTLTSA